MQKKAQKKVLQSARAANAAAAALVGMLLILGSDLVGQFVLGTRFPVGVVTGLLGAPYLLYLLVTMSRR